MKECPACGKAVVEQDEVCPWCQAPLGAQADGIPVRTSGKAIASLILGIPFFFLLPSIAAVVLGHLATRDINRSRGRLKGKGLAVGGLVLGYFGLALVPLLVAAFIIPNVLKSKMLANEASAIGSLRVISTASTAYSSAYNNGFAPSLAALGPPPGGKNTFTCDYAGLIDNVLAQGRKNGYVFTYTGAKPLPGTMAGCSRRGFQNFTIVADPVKRGSTGVRSFYMDASGVIRYSETRPATGSDPPLE